MDIINSESPKVLGGKTVHVRGLSLKEITRITSRYEGIKKAINEAEEVSVMSIIEMLLMEIPEAVTDVIVLSSDGSVSREEAEQAPLRDQIGVMDAIIEKTMPETEGPLVRMLKGMVKSLAEE